MSQTPSVWNVYWPRSFKAIIVFAIRLARLNVFACNKTDEFVSLHTYWANVVHRLSVSHVLTQTVNYGAKVGLKHFVTSFFLLEFVLALKFLANCPQCFAKLDIHHVRACELHRQRIEQLRSLLRVWRFVRGQHVLDRNSGLSSLSGQTYCASGKTKHCPNLCNIQNGISFLNCRVLRTESALVSRPSMERNA